MLRHKQQQLIEPQQRYGQPVGARVNKTQTCDVQLEEDEEDRRWRETARMLADHQELPLFGSRKNVRENSRTFAVQDEEEEEGEEAERMSMLSGAQSGCHSILSGWNLRSSLRGSRLSRQQQLAAGTASIGAKSILSGISSSSNRNKGAGQRRGKSPASQTRIPLGPKSGQHFVTNTRRRRQASELILSTVEARRQTIEAQRLQVAASLLGSSSYLAAPEAASLLNCPGEFEATAMEKRRALNLPSQRLSSVSPTTERQLSSSPIKHSARTDNSARRRNIPATLRASEAQRNRLLLAAGKRPPLAKLDQNSSDLCSSNGSSSSAASSRAGSPDSSASSSASNSSSSGSQFTQLVRAECKPRLLKMDEAVASDIAKPATNLQAIVAENRQQRANPPVAHLREQQPTIIHPAAATAASELESTGRLRRGALRRDSIRKLRLDRNFVKVPQQQQQHQPVQSSASDSSSSAGPSQPSTKRLSPSRRLDIEQNPFLNRHHFRSSTTSTSSSHPQSAAASGRLSASPAENAATWINSNSNLSPSRRSSPQPKPEDLVVQQHTCKPAAPPRPRPQARAQVVRPGSSNLSLNPDPSHLEPRPLSSEQPSASSRFREQRLSYPRQQQPSTERLIKLERPGETSALDNDAQVQQVEQMLRQIRPNQTMSWRTTSVHQMSSESTHKSVQGIPVRAPVRRQVSTETSSPPTALDRTKISLINTPQQSDHPQTGRELIDGSANEPRDDLSITTKPARVVLRQEDEHDTLQRIAEQRQKAKEQEVDLVRKEILERWRIETESRESMLREEKSVMRKPQVVADSCTVGSEKRALSPRPTSISPPIAFADPQTSRSKVLVSSTGESSAPQVNQSALTSQQRPTSRPPCPPTRPTPSPRPVESTPAVDEFTKRVDRLRKMAAAARTESPETTDREQFAKATESAGASRSDKIGQVNEPVASNNWFSEIQLPTSPEVQSKTTEKAAEAKDSRNEVPQRAPSPLLLTQRDYTPLARFGRSQSSLEGGSLASPLRSEQLTRDNYSRQGSSQQLVDSDSATIPVRLLVRERSAPQLDYAFVEPQPSVQWLIQQNTSSPQEASNFSRSPINPARPSATPASQQQQIPNDVRSHSPRSPEFGNNPASSSNDDSAIASSVSSPSSLSLMAPLNPNNRQQAELSRGTSALPRIAAAGVSSRPTPPQGILRRQQQSSVSSEYSDGPTEGSGLKRAPAQLSDNQQQLPLEPLFRSDARSPDPMQMKLASSSVGSPAKRVHFNDRTSIRSFESLSSLASDTTAVPAELLRQQLGSPDSIGSGGSGSGSGMSRLSAESPDLRGKNSGAAIYAVRGDPELEVHSELGQVNTSSVDQLINLPVAQQPQQIQRPIHVQPAVVDPRILQQQSVVMMQPSYLKMPENGQSPAAYQQAHAFSNNNLIRPNQPSIISRTGRAGDEDDEDTEYVMRLRRAATSKVFSAYVAPQVAPQSVHQQASSLTNSRRRIPNLESQLLNFQTEV